MRRLSGRPARLAGLGLIAGLCWALSGCGQPQYRFVGSGDHDAILRVPHSWTAINTDAGLKASGVDPATAVGWTAFYDASPKPAVAHVQTSSNSDPLLLAQTIPLSKDQAGGVTGADLLELLLPGASDAERTAATKAHAYALLKEESIAKKGESGTRVRFALTVGPATEIFDGVALIDPKHHGVHLAVVHCTQSCYVAHSAEIADVVTSLTLKAT